jgi:hypothetical protein
VIEMRFNYFFNFHFPSFLLRGKLFGLSKWLPLNNLDELNAC